ncbi:MAG: glutaredoxin family protein [Methylophilaceae bacterium]
MIKKIILLVTAAFLFQHFYTAGTPQVQAGEIKHNNVILYATSWCSYCKKTRAFLAKNNIKYTEYDVEKSEEGRKQHKALGGKGVPVLDIKGTVIYGYSVKNMESIFKQLNLM